MSTCKHNNIVQGIIKWRLPVIRNAKVFVVIKHVGKHLLYSPNCCLFVIVCFSMLPDVLISWLELFQWIQTAQYLTIYEEESDVFEVVTSGAQNVLMTWKFTPLYKDPIMFSNSNQVLLFLKEMFFCRLCHASSELDLSHINVCIFIKIPM